ncbi:MAG: hypothetical protein HKN47_02525, partial [Pirellulaceae bacterium]|nr:hypothetical protein [Pirellulaceae bacterium]
CYVGHIATTPFTFVLFAVGYLLTPGQPIADPDNAPFIAPTVDDVDQATAEIETASAEPQSPPQGEVDAE